MREMAQKKNSKDKEECPDPMSSGEMPKQTSKKKKISFHSLPTLPLPDKEIHRRQVIPPVTEGKKTPDNTPTPPVDPD
jgi:hypothetical protein